MPYLGERFKDGDIVWANWVDVKLKRDIGVVVGIHPDPRYQDPTAMDQRVLVKLPGYVSERAFMPDTECRHATEAEKKQYFKDVLKHGC